MESGVQSKPVVMDSAEDIALADKMNAAKQKIESALKARRGELTKTKLSARLAEQTLDPTLPDQKHDRDNVHPVIRT